MTSDARADLNRRPHVLYRMLDSAGALIYVGITASPAARMRDHAGGLMWWDEVQTITLERFPDRPSVEAAERAAIKAEQPRYNIAHAGPGAYLRRRAQSTAELPLGADPLLLAIRAETDAFWAARELLISALRRAFDAGVPRALIGEAAGITTDAVYKLLRSHQSSPDQETQP